MVLVCKNFLLSDVQWWIEYLHALKYFNFYSSCINSKAIIFEPCASAAWYHKREKIVISYCLTSKRNKRCRCNVENKLKTVMIVLEWGIKLSINAAISIKFDVYDYFDEIYERTCIDKLYKLLLNETILLHGFMTLKTFCIKCSWIKINSVLNFVQVFFFANRYPWKIFGVYCGEMIKHTFALGTLIFFQLPEKTFSTKYHRYFWKIKKILPNI